jgi:WD40 repeat protein
MQKTRTIVVGGSVHRQLATSGRHHETNAVAWSPDAARLATADNHGNIQLWDPTTGEAITTLRAHVDSVNAAAWSPDGTCLATAGRDRKVLIWDPMSERPMLSLTGHTDNVNGIAWSPDGNRLATTSDDGVIIVWTGGEVLTSVTIQATTAVAWLKDAIAIGQWGEPALIKVTD